LLNLISMPIYLLNVIYACLLNNILGEMSEMHAWLFKLYVTRKLSKLTTILITIQLVRSKLVFSFLDFLFDRKIV